MTSATHYAFSYLVCTAAGIPPAVALPASLVSLIPDIDHPQSLAGRVFPFASKYLLRKYGHRTVTHSLPAIAALLVLLAPLIFLSGSLYASLLLAYCSHIFIDLFNRSGVKLLAPFSQKEYISFRTPELRILVSSWQEYLLLFLIVLAGFSITGESFSINRAVRSISKLFYRHYDGALNDYRSNSEYLCIARVEYFDAVTAKLSSERFIVLTMFPEKLYALRLAPSSDNSKIIPIKEGRVILKKSEINEIDVIRTDRRINTVSLSGSSLSGLTEIPAGSFVSGTITIKNYNPDLKNTEFIRIDHTPSSSTITLTCAMPSELGDIIRIEKEREREIRSIRSKTSVFQIDRLSCESSSIKRRLAVLQRRGFYENYLEINLLNNELKKIDSRVETLRMREASGADVDLLMKIERLEKDFAVEYRVHLVSF